MAEHSFFVEMQSYEISMAKTQPEQLKKYRIKSNQYVIWFCHGNLSWLPLTNLSFDPDLKMPHTYLARETCKNYMENKKYGMKVPTHVRASVEMLFTFVIF